MDNCFSLLFNFRKFYRLQINQIDFLLHAVNFFPSLPVYTCFMCLVDYRQTPIKWDIKINYSLHRNEIDIEPNHFSPKKRDRERERETATVWPPLKWKRLNAMCPINYCRHTIMSRLFSHYTLLLNHCFSVHRSWILLLMAMSGLLSHSASLSI